MTLYIVLNEDGQEGFVTNDYEEARYAAGNIPNGSAYSTLGNWFREQLPYRADVLDIQEVIVTKPNPDNADGFNVNKNTRPLERDLDKPSKSKSKERMEREAKDFVERELEQAERCRIGNMLPKHNSEYYDALRTLADSSPTAPLQEKIDKIWKHLTRPCVRLSPTRDYNPHQNNSKPWRLLALDGKLVGYGQTLKEAEDNFDTAFRTFDNNCKMVGVSQAFEDIGYK